ncbi:hypothetical protein IAI10_13710 [Clostridium sp. 19966]|uniref:hypothetical protein n=1 Tax=Clostridium sp. 19966 TaxID=2768166 RepID=UPI0028E092B1|nr:hypothetical protein [Clostridium sp. 19966]MDT8717720.1 hypothetical protein [Clostridium sp. 19966]
MKYVLDNVDSNSEISPQKTSKNKMGIIDSITKDLTSVRLQQAIVLSEIVGKPRSKNRRRRRNML